MAMHWNRASLPSPRRESRYRMICSTSAQGTNTAAQRAASCHPGIIRDSQGPSTPGAAGGSCGHTGGGERGSQMHIPQRALAVAGTAMILLGGGTVALAMTSSSPVKDGIVHGCYTKAGTHDSHTLVLQDAGTACPTGDTAVEWNEKGPAGPAGPSTSGPSGLDVITVTSQSDLTTAAFCPQSNPHLIGGGGEAVPITGNLITDSPLHVYVYGPPAARARFQRARPAWMSKGLAEGSSLAGRPSRSIPMLPTQRRPPSQVQAPVRPVASGDPTICGHWMLR
jgi:hypothetical protein